MSNNEKYREAYDILCEWEEEDSWVPLENWKLDKPATKRTKGLSKWLLDNKGLEVDYKEYIYLQDLQKAIDHQKVPVYNPVKNISHSKYERCTKTHNGVDLYQSRISGCVWMYKSTCNKYYYWADYNAKNEVIYFRGEVDWVKDNYEAYETKDTTACAGIIMDMENWNPPKNDDFIDFSDHNEFIKDVPAVKRLPVKSDGGKSSYYEVNCPQWFIDKVNNGSFMVEDLAEIMYGNDFNYTNILKAQKRMYEMENGGGKEGNTLEYDATKCKYYVDKQLEIAKRG